MSANVIIYPERIQSKADRMNLELQTLERETLDQIVHLKEVISSETKAILMGKAWDTVIRYVELVQIPLMETYLFWVREQRNANNRYRLEAAALPQIPLNRERLEWDLRGWERSLSREESEEEPSYSAIRFYRRMIRETEDKLRRIERFLANTNGIYNRAEQIQATLNQADGQLKQVKFNQSENSIRFGALSNEWLLELSAASAMQYLLTNGMTETEIKELDDMGFTPEEIKEMHLLLRTEEDRSLFKHLIRKEYVPAFQINPNRLSAEVIYILVYYTDKLMEKGKIEELERMINAILYTDEEHSWYPNEWNKNAYGTEYLNRLFAVSGKLLEDNARVLMAIAGEMNPEKQKKLCEEIERLANINVLWGAIQEVAYENRYFNGSGIENKSLQFPYGFRIEDLELSESGFSLMGEYQTAWIKDATLRIAGRNISELEWHPENRLIVCTRILTEASEMEAQEFRETLSDIRKEQETLWMKYAANIGMAGMSLISPETSAVMGFIKGIANNSASGTALNGWRSLEKSGLLKPEFVSQYGRGTSAALQTAGNWVDYFNEMERLKQAEYVEKELRKVKWFGSVSKFTAEREISTENDENGKRGMTDTVNVGFYNPEGIINLKKWEEVGIVSVLDKENAENKKYEEIIKVLKNDLSKNNDWSTIPKDVLTLLDGGNIFTMDTEALETAVEKISVAFDKLKYGSIRLQERFQE